MTHIKLLDLEALRKKKQAEYPDDESVSRDGLQRVLDYLNGLHEQGEIRCLAVVLVHKDKQTVESTAAGPTEMNDLWILTSALDQLRHDLRDEIGFLDGE